MLLWQCLNIRFISWGNFKAILPPTYIPSSEVKAIPYNHQNKFSQFPSLTSFLNFLHTININQLGLTRNWRWYVLIKTKPIANYSIMGFLYYLFHFFSRSNKAGNQFPSTPNIFFWITLQSHADLTILFNLSLLLFVFLLTSSMQLLSFLPLLRLPFLIEKKLYFKIQLPKLELISVANNYIEGEALTSS